MSDRDNILRPKIVSNQPQKVETGENNFVINRAYVYRDYFFWQVWVWGIAALMWLLAYIYFIVYEQTAWWAPVFLCLGVAGCMAMCCWLMQILWNEEKNRQMKSWEKK